MKRKRRKKETKNKKIYINQKINVERTEMNNYSMKENSRKRKQKEIKTENQKKK